MVLNLVQFGLFYGDYGENRSVVFLIHTTNKHTYYKFAVSMQGWKDILKIRKVWYKIFAFG